MEIELNAHEARVLGVLIEKALTTPDGYPLTLNALVNGCNQKSNRDPVVDFTEAEVTVALTGLRMKGLVTCHVPAGSRVEKWSHGAAPKFSIDVPQQAVLAELLLRGAQAPGELRARANRMSSMPSQDTLLATLTALHDHGLVRRCPPAPGSRAERWGQTLTEDLAVDAPAPAAPPSTSTPASPPAPVPSSTDRVAALEARVATLEARLDALTRPLDNTPPAPDPIEPGSIAPN